MRIGNICIVFASLLQTVASRPITARRNQILREVSSPTEIKDGINIKKHGHSFTYSENNDKTEKMKIEDQIHSCIEALKDAVRRDSSM